MRTTIAKVDPAKKKWVIVDLDGMVLGRAATQIATILRGKNRPDYTPHLDTGDFVVAINAAKIKLTGKKLTDKIYYNHSGYMGGLKEINAGALLSRKPTELIVRAVKGMIPRNKLGDSILTKLKVYADDNHPHQAQQPEVLNLQ